MSPLFAWEKIELVLRSPRLLANGTPETFQTYWMRLDGDAGWGEAAIPAHYKLDTGGMTSYWDRLLRTKRKPPETLEDVDNWVGSDGPAPARAAMDLACCDRIARKSGVPLFTLLGLPQPSSLPTSFTLTTDTPEAMAEAALRLAAYPVLKIKLGNGDDLARLQAIHAARPDARIRVDANASWNRQKALEWLGKLEGLGLELLEQPLVKEDLGGLGWLQKQTSIPIIADESVQTEEEVKRLAASGVAGIKLKLMKLGGLIPTLKILHLAQGLGLRIMLGSVMETSIGVTAVAHLSGAAQWLDLDAPLLLSNDPFQGVEFDEHANLKLRELPGIGLVR